MTAQDDALAGLAATTVSFTATPKETAHAWDEYVAIRAWGNARMWWVWSIMLPLMILLTFLDAGPGIDAKAGRTIGVVYTLISATMLFGPIVLRAWFSRGGNVPAIVTYSPDGIALGDRHYAWSAIRAVYNTDDAIIIAPRNAAPFLLMKQALAGNGLPLLRAIDELFTSKYRLVRKPEYRPRPIMENAHMKIP